MLKVKLGKKYFYLKVSSDESKNVTSVTVYEKYKETLDYFFDLTARVEGTENHLQKNEILVKSWSGNSKYFKDLLATGLFKDTNRKIAISQFCEAHVWEINQELKKEF